MAAFLEAIGVERAHVAGVSLGAAVGTHMAVRHPARVRSLSLHSAWDATDPFLRTLLESWMTLERECRPVGRRRELGRIFPGGAGAVLTPEMYAERPDFVAGLDDFCGGCRGTAEARGTARALERGRFSRPGPAARAVPDHNALSYRHRRLRRARRHRARPS